MSKEHGDLNINTKINTDNVAKEIDGLKNKLTKLTGANVIKSISGLSAAFIGITTAVKTTAKVIKETTEAYRVQATAEKQLESAAKNNPYLDASSVRQLKDYASQLQSISTTGDEEIIPLMAQLAAAGRTQTEIQNILSAALDMSAAGVMSLDQATQTLNATYSGNIGLLGRQYTDLKNLTAEELASGKAVELMGQKFAGMAQDVASSTGSSQQLKNAWGDLKEEIGATFEKNMTPMRNFFTELINGWTNAAKERRNYKEAKVQNAEDKSTTETLENEIKGLEQTIKMQELTVAGYDRMTNAQKKRAGVSDKTVQNAKDELQTNKDLLATRQEELKTAQEIEKAAADKAASDKAAADAKTAQQEKDDAALKFMNENQAALDKQIEQIKLKAQLSGEEVDQQELLNAYMQSYIDLVTGSSLVTENNPFAKTRLAELENFAKGIQTVDDGYEDLLKTIQDFLGGDENGGALSDSIQATIDQLEIENAALNTNYEAWKKNAEKIEELEKLKTKVIEKEKEAQTASTLEQAQKVVSNVSDYLNEFSSIVDSISEIAAQSSENQTNQALADLSDQYNEGLISYEEYCNGKTEIAKKAAQEEYQEQMWQYHANVLTATANAALAVLKAYADSGAVGAAIAGAASALSVATVVANKPTMPAFATGGIVGGNNYNDGIIARLSSREMVLTQAQQAQLFKMANGSNGGGGINLKVINNRGNDTTVGATMTASGLQVTIDSLVNKSMIQGNYNKTMNYAQNNADGMRIL